MEGAGGGLGGRYRGGDAGIVNRSRRWSPAGRSERSL